MKYIIHTLIALFLLSSCITDSNYQDRTLKKSSNNRYFDMRGTSKNRRPPLYNRKYVKLAKHNISSGNIDNDFDDDDEYIKANNPKLDNQNMYMQMLQDDVEYGTNNSAKMSKRNKHRRKLGYPSLSSANHRVESQIDYQRHNENELREELGSIKEMLNEARREMATYKCPSVQEAELEKMQNMKHKQTLDNLGKSNNVQSL